MLIIVVILLYSSRGSVLVDYFVFLDNVDRPVSTDQVRSLFHASLLQADDPEESGMGENRLSPLGDEKLRLGRYTIDPRFTDFKGKHSRILQSTSTLQ